MGKCAFRSFFAAIPIEGLAGRAPPILFGMTLTREYTFNAETLCPLGNE